MCVMQVTTLCALLSCHSRCRFALVVFNTARECSSACGKGPVGFQKTIAPVLNHISRILITAHATTWIRTAG
uniref:Putative secreted protein n=1 Tax=Anopheles triannulatus TaxID=58253 RepID=A0A2M4B6E1_9DIPT